MLAQKQRLTCRTHHAPKSHFLVLLSSAQSPEPHTGYGHQLPLLLQSRCPISRQTLWMCPRQSCSSPRCLPSFSRGRASLLPGVCGRGHGLSCLQGWGSWPPGAPRSLWTSSAPWPAREPPGDFISGAKGLRPASSGWDASVSACLPGAGRPLRHRASRQPGALGRLSRLILSF